MDFATILLRGFVLGLTLAIPLGPINLEIIRRGLTRRPLDGYVLGMGACTVDLVYATLAGLGLTALLRAPVVEVICLGLGTLLLGWLAWGALRGGWRQWRAPDVLALGSSPTSGGLLAGYLTGIAMTASSPYNILFWMSVPARFFAGQTITLDLVLLTSLAVLLGTFTWVTLLVGIITWARRFVTARHMAGLSLLAGLLLAGFAVWTGWGLLRALTG